MAAPKPKKLMCSMCMELVTADECRVVIYAGDERNTEVECHGCYVSHRTEKGEWRILETAYMLTPAPHDEFADEIAALEKEKMKAKEPAVKKAKM